MPPAAPTAPARSQPFVGLQDPGPAPLKKAAPMGSVFAHPPERAGPRPAAKERNSLFYYNNGYALTKRPNG
jgi:hypothetical protein